MAAYDKRCCKIERRAPSIYGTEHYKDFNVNQVAFYTLCLEKHHTTMCETQPHTNWRSPQDQDQEITKSTPIFGSTNKEIEIMH